MAICGVAAAHPVLTYLPRTLRSGARGALHLTIPERAQKKTASIKGLLPDGTSDDLSAIHRGHDRPRVPRVQRD
jgi:hypothetical protein